MLEPEENTFGKIRSYLWPIHSYELKKFLPMLAMFFLLSFCYNSLRNLKDALIVANTDAGAQVIPFVKVWVMFPMAILMTWAFAKLSSRLSRAQVFYSILLIFLFFFACFTFLLYPVAENLHFHSLADRLELILPKGARGFVAMVRYWSFSLFYGMSELWSNIVLFLLFWGFANEITRIGEAKRFYGLMGLGANVASMITAEVAIGVSSWSRHSPVYFGINSWHQTLIVLTLLIIVSGLGVMGIFSWMQRHVLQDPKYYCPQRKEADERPKEKLSMRESISYLMKSPYLMNLATIVISYNLVINLVEVVWKHYVKALHPDPNAYHMYINNVTFWTGAVACFISIFFSSNLIRRCGWTFTAMTTPVILMLTSVFFFAFILFSDQLGPLTEGLMGMSALSIVVFFGSAQNILSRSAKYTVYDATKELAFVPLSDECKLRGKTIIDGVGQRLGKSGGSVIHQGLLLLFSSLPACCPYVAGLLVLLICSWMGSTVSLGRKFQDLVSGHSPAEEKDTVEETTEPQLVAVNAAEA